MELILGAGILLIYIYGVYYLFNKLTKVIAGRTDDFVIQIVPSWIIVLISSILIALIIKENLSVYLIFYGVFYFSIIVTSSLFVLYFIIRLLNPSFYEKIINKIRYNMNK